MKGVPEVMAGFASIHLNGDDDAASIVDGEIYGEHNSTPPKDAGSGLVQGDHFDPLQRSYSTYSTTTAGDDDFNDFTSTPSMDETATLFEADSRHGTTATTFHVTYRDCMPLNVFRSLKTNQGALFDLRFEGCQMGSASFSNCIMLNVTFDNCKFSRDTVWANVFLKDVSFVNCIFDAHTWLNGSEEETVITGRKRIRQADFGDEVPWEIANPDFLENEADGTNETRRKFEPEAVIFDAAKPDMTAKEMREWNEAEAKEWVAKGRKDWHIAELEASILKPWVVRLRLG